MSLRRITLGTVAMSCVGMMRLLAQFFVVPVLSRILSPADYGVVAMAMPFVLFTMIFTDAGLGQSLVRSAQRDTDIWSTSFWLTIALGLGLALMIAAAAPAAAFFFDEPRLLPVVLALAPIVLLHATCTIPQAAIQQERRFRVIAVADIVAIAAGIGTALLVALAGGGVWALVAQLLAHHGTKCLAMFGASPFRPRLTFSMQGIREHLLFGRDVLGSHFVTYLIQTASPFIIGKVLGAALLGFYTMAFLFARLPVRLIAGPLQYVLYAHLAPHSAHTPLIRQMFLFLTRGLVTLVFPAMGLVAAAHEPFFTLLLSEKWQLTGELFLIAAPAAALQAAVGLGGTFMLIVGRADIQLRAAIEYALVMVALLLATVGFGLKWVVAGYSLSVFLYLPRRLALILPRLECSMGAYFRAITLPAAITFFWMFLYVEADALMTLNDWTRVGLAFSLGVCALGTGALLQCRSLLAEMAWLRQNGSAVPT